MRSVIEALWSTAELADAALSSVWAAVLSTPGLIAAAVSFVVSLVVAFFTVEYRLRRQRMEREKEAEPAIDCIVASKDEWPNTRAVEFTVTNNWPVRATLTKIALKSPKGGGLINYEDVLEPDGAGGRGKAVTLDGVGDKRVIVVDRELAAAGTTSNQDPYAHQRLGPRFPKRTEAVVAYLRLPTARRSTQVTLIVEVVDHGVMQKRCTRTIKRTIGS